jgi:hypothetical protein
MMPAVYGARLFTVRFTRAGIGAGDPNREALTGCWQAAAMANKRAPKKGRRYAAIGDRLEHIAKSMDYNGAQMAKALRIGAQQWSVYQSGTREIRLEYAKRLCDLANVSLDYIYRGKKTH